MQLSKLKLPRKKGTIKKHYKPYMALKHGEGKIKS